MNVFFPHFQPIEALDRLSHGAPARWPRLRGHYGGPKAQVFESKMRGWCVNTANPDNPRVAREIRAKVRRVLHVGEVVLSNLQHHGFPFTANPKMLLNGTTRPGFF